MHKAIRHQGDDRELEYSLVTSLTIKSDDPDRARQEYKNDADINVLMKKYGVDVPQRGGARFGEQDFDMNLQDAYFAVNEAKRAYQAMPRAMRRKYPTWQTLLTGIEQGTFKTDLAEAKAKAEEEKAKREAPPPVKPPTDN